MTDIENRKKIFMDSFALNLHRKMTVVGNLQNNLHGSSSNPFNTLSKPQANKSQINVNRSQGGINAAIGMEKPMDTDPIGDNAAMSVDGDISYSSIDMDETLLQGQDNSLQVKSNIMLLSKKATDKKQTGVV
jgi:hypothetical protein